ncbi:DUF2283 domain-containing protein [Methylobacterium tarhaniae]|uniref:DUF2283 domain-containing protein n=1 Tax=Methylobacterium tarhaniae TaxID=1187852 RepID=UPI0009FA8CED|nr:DUF2283 domain-containing protein [Methylobacterium tarhaniae]
MKSRHDAETDALYVRFADAPVVGSEEVRPGLILDFDADGRIVAVEILGASEHLSSDADLRHMTVA